MEERAETLQNSPKLPRRKIAALIMSSLLILAVAFLFFLQVGLTSDWQCLDDLISVRITRADGSEEAYDSNQFPVTNRGDVVMVTIPLPEERMVENSALCLNIFHTTLEVFYGNELLFSYGLEHAAEGRFIGNTFQRIPLRNEMWGGEITLRLVGTENSGCSVIQDVQIISQLDSHRYYFAQYQSTVILFAFIIAVAFVVLLILLLSVGYPLRRQGVYLCLFAIMVPAWYLTSRGFTFTFTNNINLASHMEYVIMYLLPIPFCLFMYFLQQTSHFHKVFSLTAALFFGALFILATVLNYTTTIHYSDLLLPANISMLAGMVVFVCQLMRRTYQNDRFMRIIRYGVCITVVSLILEILRINVRKFSVLGLFMLDLSLTPISMIIFIGALAASYTMQLLDLQKQESDKAVLRRLAYVDVTTGMSNRTYCYEQIAEMERLGEKYFALLFFDVNGLKTANDSYGHEMGDRFLQLVARALQDTFGNQRFCARWGGDEFVVCITGEQVHKVDDMLHEFDKKLQEANRNGEFPFPISVAYGVVRSSEEQIVSVSDAIKEADRRMYTAKFQMMAD